MFLDLPVEKIVFVSIAILGFIIAVVTVILKRIKWGQARYMGIPKDKFFWMNVIYSLVLFAGGYGIVSTVMDWPIWTDIAITLIILLICIAIYLSLRSRPAFKVRRFIALFLIPFSIPGTGGVVKAISKAPTQEIIRYSEPVIDVLKKEGGIVLKNLGPRTSKTTDSVGNVAKVYPISIPVRGSGYSVKFKNSLEEGRLGDKLTSAYLKNDGYKKLPSQLPGGQGIDGVYIKSSLFVQVDGKIPQGSHVRIIENKVNTSPLSPGQMGTKWTDNNIEKMKNHEHLKSTAVLLEKHRSSATPELWRHDLHKSRSIVKVLNSKAEVIFKYDLPEGFIPEVIKRMCKSKSLDCIPSR